MRGKAWLEAMYKTLVVTDDEWATDHSRGIEVVSFESYLRDYPKLNEPRIWVINLCDTEKYLSKGYYCSLLADSRNHQVIPSVSTINEMRGESCVMSGNNRGLSKKEIALLSMNDTPDRCFVYMGIAEKQILQKIAARVFRQYPMPILQIKCDKKSSEIIVARCSFADLSSAQQQLFMDVLSNSKGYLRKNARSKAYRWEMAILVNEQEVTPPSNKRAITSFVKAASKLGIRATVVNAEQLLDVNRFDALFIRETTAIDHYTYRIASEAEINGLVVMDDPASILRCCNKVFLHDAFCYQDIPSLKTRIVDDCSMTTLDELEVEFNYPMVLKMPEGSFSRGVFKVKSRTELKTRLQSLLQDSALALVQEYLYTDYDWRIGILNGRPLYACKYFMAPRHWQIYNPGSKRYFSGGFETMATYEAPKAVLEAAMRACKVVGNGLYGVDIKVSNGNAYVIEVNDNPSIDHKVEDAWLGDELYMQVMSEFHRCLELRGR